ncbi:hypothetical protein FIV03_31815 (plasmid) [Labrenzia sp. THAF187b]|nr:hypothetical protein FIV03_31815 [Labrenzia sp. THAF187b]
MGAQQKRRLRHVALCLFQRQGSKIPIIERAFGHHPVDCTPHLLTYLGDREFRHGGITPTPARQRIKACSDSGLAALNGNVHRISPASRYGEGRRTNLPPSE